jgi:nucleoside-diphosphate-sugar epimerase
MCRHFSEDFGIQTRVIRYHNVYGPIGTYDGGREKAPAALCRKIALAKMTNNKNIEVWGDGEQTRSFMFIDDCIEGTKKIFSSNFNDVYNLGSSEQVSINQMITILEKISGTEVKKKYLLNMPKGVRGRSSNNDKAYKVLKWKYSISLHEGLEKTYNWIFDQIVNKKRNNIYK